MRKRVVLNGSAEILKRLSSRSVSYMRKAVAVIGSEKDDSPDTPSDQQESIAGAERDSSSVRTTSPKDVVSEHGAKPRKLVTQGRPREALKKHIASDKR